MMPPTRRYADRCAALSPMMIWRDKNNVVRGTAKAFTRESVASFFEEAVDKYKLREIRHRKNPAHPFLV